ncbi:hypothetical protein EDD15DRAFT_1467195 [Pisolithus albus]|nr:hypothetical protein EDD15DRAFT_1467195 [Pisolithus albus]
MMERTVARGWDLRDGTWLILFASPGSLPGAFLHSRTQLHENADETLLLHRNVPPGPFGCSLFAAGCSGCKIQFSQKWAQPATRSGPLAGVPVSLNDSSLGYSAFTDVPVSNDAPIVRALHGVGAIPYVKTNVTLTLYPYESINDVFDVTENLHKQGYSPRGNFGRRK